MAPRKIILRSRLSPGDIVMLTAAVRDLKAAHCDRVHLDVRTTAPELWLHNRHLTPLDETDPGVEIVDCECPLVRKANTHACHYIHAFPHFLRERLGLDFPTTFFKGDIHLSDAERAAPSPMESILGAPVPYWIVAAGGKLDFTAKWWEHARWQAVVNHFRGRILFVQIGWPGHHHPPLDGVVDLRGKTSLRQLIHLVHRAQGVLCPVTLAMHLAAAVECPPGMPKNRPCVVVAGGREPSQWEAYPHHQYIHTNGALPCCDNGGCWKSRAVPLGDGSPHDTPEKLCLDVVNLRDPALGYRLSPSSPVPPHALPTAPKFSPTDFLPRCLDMIPAEEVIRRIELYFTGGSLRYLSREEADFLQEKAPRISP